MNCSKTFPRPRRAAQVSSRYEVTPAGLDAARQSALRAVRQVEEDYSDLAAEAQEGATVRPEQWNALACRLNARIAALDAQVPGTLNYADLLEATRLQTALDVLTEYAPTPDPAARILSTREMFGL